MIELERARHRAAGGGKGGDGQRVMSCKAYGSCGDLAFSLQ